MEQEHRAVPLAAPGHEAEALGSRWARWAALGVAALGALVLLGWALDAAALRSLHPAWVSMKANTALGFVLCGLALWPVAVRDAQGRPATGAGVGVRSGARLAAVVAGMLGALTLAETFLGVSLGIDQWLVAEPVGTVGTASPGRMSPLTAVSFVLSAIALLILLGDRAPAAGGPVFHGRSDSGALADRLVHGLALAVALISLMALIGYAYGAHTLYQVPAHSGMAVHTALGFLLLAAGLICARSRGWVVAVLAGRDAAGVLARRLLPALLLLPIALGMLRMHGQRVGWFTPEFGAALTTVAMILVLGVLILWTGTLLRRQEHALHRQAGLMRSIFDSLGEGVSVADASGRLTQVNRRGQEIVGYGASDAPSSEWSREFGVFRPGTAELLPVDEMPLIRALHGEVVEDAELLIRNPRRPAGVYVCCSARAIRDDAGHIGGAVVVFRDVTEQRLARRRLERAALYEQTHGAALTLFNQGMDRATILASVLRLLAQHHPFPAAAFYRYDDWRGSFELEAGHAAPAGAPRVLHMGEGLAGQACADNELRVFDAAGSGWEFDLGLARIAPAAVIAVPVSHRELRQGVLLVASAEPVDEAARTFLQRLCSQLGLALHNLNQYESLKLLADQLRARGEEIAQKNSQLQAADRMKTEFLANMSHELRTPLNAVLGFSQVLEGGMVGALTDRQIDCVRHIRESGEHLLSLINDILDLSKIEAGHMVLEAEPADVRELLKNTVAIVREKAAKRRLDLKVEPAAEPLMAEVDTRKVKQIAYNLLSNAVKFTAEGGRVSLAVETARGIDLAERQRDGEWGLVVGSPLRPDLGYVGLAVSDTGIGIDPPDLQRIFRPFVQVDSSLSRQYSGTGLGLVMVLRLTELHGGLISVSSSPGAGSVFTAWLPMAQREPREQPVGGGVQAGPPTRQAVHDVSHTAHGVSQVGASVGSVTSVARPGPGRGSRACRALVVEDDPRAAELLRMLLTEDGFEVHHALDGETALRMAQQQAYQLVTLDLMLPGMDGWATLAGLKALPGGAQMRVVIVSMVGADHVQKGLSLGACGVLQKPVQRAQLLSVLDELGLHPPVAPHTRVLLVDDDPRAVEIVSTFLGEIPGFDIECAYEGAQAIELARRLVPDLMVLDLMMPGTSGFDVVHALQQDARAAHVPIIVLTAKTLSPDERRQLQGRVHLVLGKAGFSREAFLGEVRRAVRTRQAAAEPELIEGT